VRTLHQSVNVAFFNNFNLLANTVAYYFSTFFPFLFSIILSPVFVSNEILFIILFPAIISVFQLQFLWQSVLATSISLWVSLFFWPVMVKFIPIAVRLLSHTHLTVPCLPLYSPFFSLFDFLPLLNAVFLFLHLYRSTLSLSASHTLCFLSVFRSFSFLVDFYKSISLAHHYSFPSLFTPCILVAVVPMLSLQTLVAFVMFFLPQPLCSCKMYNAQ
jgi:hypothetical protein